MTLQYPALAALINDVIAQTNVPGDILFVLDAASSALTEVNIGSPQKRTCLHLTRQHNHMDLLKDFWKLPQVSALHAGESASASLQLGSNWFRTSVVCAEKDQFEISMRCMGALTAVVDPTTGEPVMGPLHPVPILDTPAAPSRSYYQGTWI